MKILVSAFACLPNTGSEGGVGWSWAHEWASDHEVVVLTDITRREAVEAELSHQTRTNPRFVFFRPTWLRWMPLNSMTAQLLYQLWQIGAVPFVRALHRQERFDLIHHVTYAVFRQPSLLGRCGVPLVFGPVGGGEDAPWRMKHSMPLRDRTREALRSLVNLWARHDPMLRDGLRHAVLVLATTSATARAMPRGFESRTEISLASGTVPREGAAARAAPAGRALHLVYAGSFFALKGLHLGLRAMAAAVCRGADLRLTLIGDGPMRPHLHRLAVGLGIGARVHWMERLPQNELLARYPGFDALLFPSLHDSTGGVVLEALSFALPVVCFDLGGPAEIVTPTCGRVVSTAGLDEEGAVAAMGEALCQLQADPALYVRLSAGALARALELDWTVQAGRIKRMALEAALPHNERALPPVTPPLT